MKGQGQSQGQVDAILEDLNPLGLYALTQWLGFTCCNFSLVFQLFAIVFVGKDVFHTCSTQNTTAESHPPLENESAAQTGNFTNGLVHFAFRDSSIVSEFGLVCEKASLVGLTQTLLTVGQGLGCLLLPALVDRWGRKRLQLITHALTLVSSTLTALAPNYFLLAVGKVFIGVGIIGLRMTLVTATLEVFPARFRSVTSAVAAGVAFALCSALLAPLAYSLRFESWRTLQLVLTSASLLLVVQWIILDEPLRWLLANSREHEARKVIQKACRWNRKPAHWQQSLGPLTWAPRTAPVEPQSASCKQCSCEGTESRPSTDKEACLSTEAGMRPENTGKSQVKPEEGNRSRARKSAEECKSCSKDLAAEEEKNLLLKVAVQWSECPDKQLGVVTDNDQLNGQQLTTEGDCADGFRQLESHARKLTLLDVLRHRRMRKNVFIACLLWFVDSLAYFGLYLTSSSLAGDLYVNFFLNAVVEIPASLLYFFTLDRWGRKWTLYLFHIVGGVGLLASGICRVAQGSDTWQILSTVLSLIGKLGVTACLNVISMYTGELFPTNCRNQGLGAASAVGRVGSMMAPFATLLAQQFPWAPGVIFGSCCFLATSVLTCVPETKGRELPQTVEDLENFYTDEKPAKK